MLPFITADERTRSPKHKCGVDCVMVTLRRSPALDAGQRAISATTAGRRPPPHYVCRTCSDAADHYVNEGPTNTCHRCGRKSHIMFVCVLLPCPYLSIYLCVCTGSPEHGFALRSLKTCRLHWFARKHHVDARLYTWRAAAVAVVAAIRRRRGAAARRRRDRQRRRRRGAAAS